MIAIVTDQAIKRTCFLFAAASDDENTTDGKIALPYPYLLPTPLTSIHIAKARKIKTCDRCILQTDESIRLPHHLVKRTHGKILFPHKSLPFVSYTGMRVVKRFV